MEKVQKKSKAASLYEWLGGEAKVRKIVNDILDKNYNNPHIGHHFPKVDMKKLKQLVFEFFSMGTGGPHRYTGRDIRASHAGLNLNEDDFQRGNLDIEQALKENGIGETERNEVMAILNSMKRDVIGG